MKPRVSLFITELSMGGAARVVRDHAAAFADFAEVREVVFNRADGVDYDGRDLVSLDVGGGGSIVTRIANFTRRVGRYRAYKQAWEPDISVAHLEGAQYVDVLSGGRARRVMVAHGSIFGNANLNGWVGIARRRLLLPLTFRAADAVVAVSRDIGAELCRLGVSNVRVINNFFDIARIEQLAAGPLSADEEAIVSGPPLVVTAGRFAPEKNYGFLLEVVARVKAIRPVRLLLLGDGPMRQDLIAKAHGLGLTISSDWTGRDPTADMHMPGFVANPFGMIARAAVFALPSSWEGFPLALCESMACGTPVMSSDCATGPREILGPDTAIPTVPIDQAEVAPFGLLMPVPRLAQGDTVSSWAQTVVTLLDDPPRRAALAASARTRVSDFSKEHIVPQWRALFDDLMQDGR